MDALGGGPEAADVADVFRSVGALPFGPGEPGCWAWSTPGGWDAVAEFSRAHPALPLNVQGFEDFRDEVTWAMVAGGDISIVSCRGVLPSGWGGCHDEGGAALDRRLLRWAGARILAHEPAGPKSSLFCELETALVVAEELGRFAADTRDFTADGAPAQEALEAVVRLGRLAADVSLASAPRSAGELGYMRPLRVTQSVVHAGHDEFADRPGHADWQWWLGTLVGSAGALVDVVFESSIAAPLREAAEDDEDMMELYARSLVTSCVQALALFGSEQGAISRRDGSSTSGDLT